MKSNKDSDPDPAGGDTSSQRKHLKISGSLKQSGFGLKVSHGFDDKVFELLYPGEVWKNFPEKNRKQLLDNLAFAFTAHLPLLKNEDLDLHYDTSQPVVTSWIYNLFLRFLPTYRHLYEGKTDLETFDVLKRILYSDLVFGGDCEEFSDDFSSTDECNVVIPFTFGKDSLLTYCLSKAIGLNPVLVCFYEPTEKYSRKHKLNLIENFERDFGEKIYFIDNGFADLRAGEDGWFGWEATLTTYALMSLPFAYSHACRYVIFSNEISCNDYFYDDRGFKIMFDYEQSDPATNDLSALLFAMTQGRVGCMNFLQGLYEIAIVAILKNNFPRHLKYLMSCWADHSGAENSRWCCECSKCARIFLFLAANGVDPQVEVDFPDNLFEEKYFSLFNVFQNSTHLLRKKGATYDSLGTNRDEQLLAFYLAYRNGFSGYVIDKFVSYGLKDEAEKRFADLLSKYYGFVDNRMIPKFYRDAVHDLLQDSLARILPNFNISYENQKENNCVFV